MHLKTTSFVCVYSNNNQFFLECVKIPYKSTHILIFVNAISLRKKKIYLERHLIVYGYCHNSDVRINTWSDCWVFSVALLGKKKTPFTLITSFSQVKIRNIWQNFFFFYQESGFLRGSRSCLDIIFNCLNRTRFTCTAFVLYVKF